MVIIEERDIWFAFSGDLAIDDVQSVWQRSDVSLPKMEGPRKCIIEHKSKSPKLLVLTGDTQLEFPLFDIIGRDIFQLLFPRNNTRAFLFFFFLIFFCL